MQTATVLSCTPQTWAYTVIKNWTVNFQYKLDAGGIGQAQVIVGGGANANTALWASVTDSVQVNAPGCANPVLLPCPDIVRWSAFGQKGGGFPIA